jgi:hypothetical protein
MGTQARCQIGNINGEVMLQHGKRHHVRNALRFNG